ncbi:putative nucleotidyltransferase [Methanophagales archaeon]|nr:putative nucleotidyltransferase [Methanophagales archaeon]
MNKTTIYKLKEALSRRLNWNHILENALQHGIAPLLYHNLSEMADVPEEVMEHLRMQYNANLARNMLVYNELSNVLNAFEHAGIEVVVLKGAALAETVYQDIGLRPFSDVDLLVRKKDLQRAKKKLVELGYILDEDVSPERYNEDFGCDLYYAGKVNVLEIHWDIMRKTKSDRYARIKIEHIWERAVPAKIAGADTRMMSPEDMLLHFCVHLPKHRYNRLIWLCDVLEVIEHTDIDWGYVLESAKKYRTMAYMYYGLHFTDVLLGCDIPEKVLNALKPHRPEIMVLSTVLKDVLSRERKIMPILNLMKLLLIDRFQDRVRYLCEYVFPPVDSLARMYSVSGKKVYLYYFVHPVYVWLETGKRLMAIVSSRAKKRYRWF